MMRGFSSWLLGLGLAALALGGCASVTPVSVQFPPITPAMAQRGDAEGQTVRWGGVIVSMRPAAWSGSGATGSGMTVGYGGLGAGLIRPIRMPVGSPGAGGTMVHAGIGGLGAGSGVDAMSSAPFPDAVAVLAATVLVIINGLRAWGWMQEIQSAVKRAAQRRGESSGDTPWRPEAPMDTK